MIPKIKFENGSDFKKIMGITSDMVEDATIKLKPEKGMIIRKRRNANMISIEIPKDAFETWEVGEETDWPLSLQNFMKVVRRCNGNESVRIYQESEGGITLEYEKGSTRKFHQSLIEGKANMFDEAMPDLPEMEGYDIEAGTLEETIKDIELRGSEIKFDHEPGRLVLRSTENSMGTQSYSHEITNDQDPLFGYSVEDEFSVSFSLPLVENAINRVSSSQKIHIKVNENVPLVMSYPIMEEGEVDAIIAPLVERK